MASPRRVELTPPTPGSLARDPARPRPPIISVSLENLRVINNTCWHGKAGKQEAGPSPPAEGAAQRPQDALQEGKTGPPSTEHPHVPLHPPIPEHQGCASPHPTRQSGSRGEAEGLQTPGCSHTSPSHPPRSHVGCSQALPRSWLPAPGPAPGWKQHPDGAIFSHFLGGGEGRFGKSRWDRESVGKERVRNGGSAALCFCGMLPALLGKPGMG